MLTKDFVKEKTADLGKEYPDFMVEHFAECKAWADASERMAAGHKVKEEKITAQQLIMPIHYHFEELCI
jgi:hypothetical protein